ncbi:WD40-repeat-containing domain protein [Radiomyces spectabilis]|uniref:WD40-repeat-containing domain protein n=1 Tax=Radiomyces spectabilis TaxID=64574 RepID=UPI002220BF54|nr:WD40-repeat-containing domain protein [Radiomyces spectabilis]KAI8370435.1 WD40-repeat-containing domain protein [Radiomyces spectabilis]
MQPTPPPMEIMWDNRCLSRLWDQMGHQPRILIWNVKEKQLMHECRAHKFGILSLAFAPNMRYLVSIGFQHDGYLYVWHWRKGIKLAGNKVTSKVNALSFSQDGTYFVTAGLRHVKFWYLDARGRLPKRGNLASRETQVLDGRSGILGALRESNFVDVGCDRGKSERVYFLTDNGILCMFKEGRVIDKWVDLQVKSAYSISVTSTYIVCACAEGIIRLFEPLTLKYCGMLPKPHPLGVDISAISSPDMIRSDKTTHYPDAFAVALDERTGKITVVYSDRSLYVWDVKELKKIGKYRSFISHSDCIWGVEPCPMITHGTSQIPPFSFATYSSDGTVRFWNLDQPSMVASSSSLSPFASHSSSPLSPPAIDKPSPTSSNTNSAPLHRKNIYSRELIKMLYVDPDAAEFAKLKRDVELAEDQYPDFGIRSLKMSNDGQLLATGDRNGNLRVHHTDTWDQITYQEAHDSEILSIDITNLDQPDIPHLIATASRDRFIHIFDVSTDFQLVQSLDDHSSSITAVRFANGAEKLISCGADKGVIFRSRAVKPPSSPYTTYHNYSGRSTVFDMALDLHARYIATVTGERRLYLFNVESGKPFRTCKPETPEEIAKSTSSENSGGSLINIDIDPFSGTFAVTSGSDRCLRLFDLTNSTCIEKACAHAELITCVKFIRTATDDLRILSTCSDGTVFVWKVGQDIVARSKARANEREFKLKQAAALGAVTDKVYMKSDEGLPDDKRAMLFGGAGKPRLRRVSTAAMIRPTPSLSQMIRQGERKTFSSVSPAEHKYDDLYKRFGQRRNRHEGSNVNGLPQQAPNRPDSSPPVVQSPDGVTSPSLPVSAGTAPSSQTRITFADPPIKPTQNRGNPITSRKDSAGNLSGRKTPDKQGKLERLYNGIPTSGRERLSIPSTFHSPPNSRMGGATATTTYLTSRPPPPSRLHPATRRQMSRDALYRKDHSSSSSSGEPSREGRFRLTQPEDPTPKRVLSPLQRRASDSGSDLSGDSSEVTDSGRSSVKSPEIPLPSKKPVVKKLSMPVLTAPKVEQQSTSDSSKNSATEHEDDRDEERDRDEEDDDPAEAEAENEDEDADELDADDEEEEIIFITSPPEQDQIGAPFEVSTHNEEVTIGTESGEGEGEGEGDNTMYGRKSPACELEADGLVDAAIEEQESDSNEDEAIIESISSRNAPRIMTSLSRTTSMTLPLRRNHPFSDGKGDSGGHHDADQLSSQCELDKTCKDTLALRELQKKLEKARKRQSFTARFLSSLGERKSSSKVPLDAALDQFDDIAQGLLDDPANRLMIPTIPIIPPITSHPRSCADEPNPTNPTSTSTEIKDETKVSPIDEPKSPQEGPKDDQAKAILSDLDGAAILLDSVLDFYSNLLSGPAESKDEKLIESIERKVAEITQKMAKVIRPEKLLTAEEIKTTNMLDAYSARLISMVESQLSLHNR